MLASKRQFSNTTKCWVLAAKYICTRVYLYYTQTIQLHKHNIVCNRIKCARFRHNVNVQQRMCSALVGWAQPGQYFNAQ